MAADPQLTRLTQELRALSDRVNRLEDLNAIRALQYTYGYYLDRHQFEDVVSLFSDDAELRFMSGIFRGRAGVERFFLENLKKNIPGSDIGPVHGFLDDHMLLQDVITVASDGNSAKARLRMFLVGGWHETFQHLREDAKRQVGIPKELTQWWEGGVYENEYAKEDGVWKISLLEFHMVYLATFEDGWAHTPLISPSFKQTFPEDPAGPDAIIEPSWTMWPMTDVVPFHYPHPVTGAPASHGSAG